MEENYSGQKVTSGCGGPILQEKSPCDNLKFQKNYLKRE